MRYTAKSLSHVYEILEEMDKYIAVFDFLSGEMGYEALCAQAICGRFHDDARAKWGDELPIVALTWKGCSLIYENVSEHQIELQDADLSMRGNVKHRGEPRWSWLVIKEHKERINKIKGIIELVGPSYWAGGHVLDERLTGFIPPHYLWRVERLKVNRAGIIESAANRLERTGYVFQPPGERLIKEPYVAFFDRNEKDRSPHRNTQKWHIRDLDKLAKAYNVKLVAIAGLHPRELPARIKHLTPKHRDLDLLCNVLRHAIFFAAPPCGAAEVACIMGCNFLALGRMDIGQGDLARMVTAREFEYFGVLDQEDKTAARKVDSFVESKC